MLTGVMIDADEEPDVMTCYDVQHPECVYTSTNAGNQDWR